MATARHHQDTRVDVKLVLSALWIVTLLVFAYVDIFGFYRGDVLEAALAGRVASASFAVGQVFLTGTLLYIVPSILMIVLSLVLRPRVNRIVNLVASLFYAITILGSCIGETWVYYIAGSVIEAILLLVIARTAWKWPLRSQP